MVRPFWSGQLQISLVSFGIRLIPATESKSEIRFHQIDRRTGERVRHQKVSSGDEEPVEKGDIVKGYEYSKGQYIQIEPEEIEQLRIASRNAIELEQFVRAAEINPSFFEKPYFVLPEDNAQAEAFAVVRKALEDGKAVGLGKFSVGGRERVVAVAPPSDPKLRGMMAYILRFAEELRDPAEFFSDIKDQKVDRDQLALAKELIRRKSAVFRPDRFTDNYEAALRELIDAKLQNMPLPKEERRESRAGAVNLMDALRESIGETNGKKKPAARADGTPGKARADRHGLKLVSARGRDKRSKTA
jgi:DNA end-binding protein Ku